MRFSVMCTSRNLVLLTLSTVELSMVNGGWSTEFLLKFITTSFVLPTLTPFRQLCHFLSVVCFIVVAVTAVIGKLDDVVGAELGSAVVGQQREEQRAEHTALWGTCAQCGSARGVVADTD